MDVQKSTRVLGSPSCLLRHRPSKSSILLTDGGTTKAWFASCKTIYAPVSSSLLP